MQDDTTLAAPALGLRVDGLSELVRMAVRRALEAATEAKLTRTLGREAWERAVTATGYRHGTMARTVVTGVGPVVLTVPRARLAQVDGTRQEWQNPVLPRYTCRSARCSRTAWYRPRQDRSADDAPVVDALDQLIDQHTRWGFWLCFGRLRAVGHAWTWKRVYRVYCALRLNLPRRRKKRLPPRPGQALEAPAVLNRTWALDFMGDTLYNGRCYRTLNVPHEGNREALAFEIGTSLTSRRVAAVLEDLVALHGAPERIR